MERTDIVALEIIDGRKLKMKGTIWIW